MFSLYFLLGFEHITDINGYDHILFLIALTVLYNIKKFKRVVILITAFTLGHSLSLAMAVLNYISFSSNIVEFLIPVTIIISALFGFFYKGKENVSKIHLFKYVSAVVFGFIHGLGFSNYLSNLLGSETSIGIPLLAFNIGLEVGQVLIVLLILFISTLFVKYTKIPKQSWVLIISGIVAGIAFEIALSRAQILF